MLYLRLSFGSRWCWRFCRRSSNGRAGPLLCTSSDGGEETAGLDNSSWCTSSTASTIEFPRPWTALEPGDGGRKAGRSGRSCCSLLWMRWRALLDRSDCMYPRSSILLKNACAVSALVEGDILIVDGRGRVASGACECLSMFSEYWWRLWIDCNAKSDAR